MRTGFFAASIAAGLLAFAGSIAADDKKDEKAGPIVLKVVSKQDKYVFDGGGKSAKEFQEELEAMAKKIAKGEPVRPPKPLAVDLVLQLENTSKEAVTVHVGGDSNVFKFDLTGGAGVVTMPNLVAMTLEFRLPKSVTIEPGKSHDIPVKVLADGTRGISRLIFWTGPGEYKLSATYTLSDAQGDKKQVVKSEATKIVVVEK